MGSLYVNPDGTFEEPKNERKYVWGNDPAVFEEDGSVAYSPDDLKEIKVENKPNSISEGYSEFSYNGDENNFSSSIHPNNIDELFLKTLELSEMVYEVDSFESGKYRKIVDEPGKLTIIRDFEFPILFNIINKTLYISFRGTSGVVSLQQGLANIYTDLSTKFRLSEFQNYIYYYETLKKYLPEKIQQIQAHAGFLKQMDLMYEKVREKIVDLSTGIDHIIVTGHSAGGALAGVFSLVYMYDGLIKNKVPIDYVVTYGSPRWIFNDTEFIKLYDDVLPNTLRVWNKDDLVTYLPFHNPPSDIIFTETLSGFSHLGKSFCLDAEYTNQNLNLLATEIFNQNVDLVKSVIKNKNPKETEELVAFMLSNEYKEMLIGGVIKCSEKCYINENITRENIQFLSNEFKTKLKTIENYTDKCIEFEPYHLFDLIKDSNLSSKEDIQNEGLSSFFGLVYDFVKTASVAHYPPHYSKLLEELISKQETNDTDLLKERRVKFNTSQQTKTANAVEITTESIINDIQVVKEGEPQFLGYVVSGDFRSGDFVELNI